MEPLKTPLNWAILPPSMRSSSIADLHLTQTSREPLSMGWSEEKALKKGHWFTLVAAEISLTAERMGSSIQQARSGMWVIIISFTWTIKLNQAIAKTICRIWMRTISGKSTQACSTEERIGCKHTMCQVRLGFEIELTFWLAHQHSWRRKRRQHKNIHCLRSVDIWFCSEPPLLTWHWIQTSNWECDFSWIHSLRWRR